MELRNLKHILPFLIAIFGLVSLFSCKKEIPEPTTTYQSPSGGGGGTTAGRVTFWNNNTSVGNITVYCLSTSATITANIAPSSCNTSGCANFSGAPGVYNFSASSTTGETWNGSVTLTSGGCLLMHLQ